MNVNEAKKLQMKKMTQELRDEEILELRRAAGRMQHPILMAAMEKICEDFGIDKCKIRKYVEYPTGAADAVEDEDDLKCKHKHEWTKVDLEEGDDISGHASYSERIGYFKKRISKIEFLQRMLEEGRNVIVSPTDAKALEYCFKGEGDSADAEATEDAQDNMDRVGAMPDEL